MGNRLDLQDILENLLGSDHVYFQPPASIQMIYPCIVYQKSKLDIRHASNIPYKIGNQYTITIIDRNPDTIIPDKVAALESSSFDRQYISDNLYHYVFNLWF